MFKSPHEEYLVISSCPPQKPGAVQSKLTAHHKKMTLHCPSQTKLGPPELIAAVQPPRHVSRVTCSAANRLIGEVVQSRRRPLLGPSPG